MKRKTAPAPPIKPGFPGRRKFWLASACAVSLLVACVSAIFGTGCNLGPWGAPTPSPPEGFFGHKPPRSFIDSKGPVHEVAVSWESKGEQDMQTMSRVVESGLGIPFHRDGGREPGMPVYVAPSGITRIHISRHRVVVSGPSVPPETKGSVEQLAAAITAAARASGLQVR